MKLAYSREKYDLETQNIDKKIEFLKLCHDIWPRNENFSENSGVVYVFSKKCYSFWNQLQFLRISVTVLPSFIFSFGFIFLFKHEFWPVFEKKESFMFFQLQVPYSRHFKICWI